LHISFISYIFRKPFRLYTFRETFTFQVTNLSVFTLLAVLRVQKWPYRPTAGAAVGGGGGLVLPFCGRESGGVLEYCCSSLMVSSVFIYNLTIKLAYTHTYTHISHIPSPYTLHSTHNNYLRQGVYVFTCVCLCVCMLTGLLKTTDQNYTVLWNNWT